MTDLRFWLAAALPILVNSAFNGVLFLAVLRRIARLEDKADVVTGGVIEVDNRVTRIEDKLL